MHKIEISPELIERLTNERGGKLHLFDVVDPARTAHLIIDLQNGFMEPGAPVEVPAAREVVPNVNVISRAMRKAGGRNIFVRFTTPPGGATGAPAGRTRPPCPGPYRWPASLAGFPRRAATCAWSSKYRSPRLRTS